MTAMQRWTLVVLTAVLGATLALPAAAQWKWRDASGHTQYSDLPPPPGTPDKDILQRPSATAAPVRAAPAASGASGVVLSAKTTDPELEANRKKAEQGVADKQKAEEAKFAAARAENCAKARTQLKAFDSGMRLARTNDKGEREYLDDKGRAQEAARARDLVASECK